MRYYRCNIEPDENIWFQDAPHNVDTPNPFYMNGSSNVKFQARYQRGSRDRYMGIFFSLSSAGRHALADMC